MTISPSPERAPTPAIEAIRDQRRHYEVFTPLTDDEVRRGAAALQRELGEWGSDRMHAQWARVVLENAEHFVSQYEEMEGP